MSYSPGRAILRPERGGERAAREDGAVGGDVAQARRSPVAGEDDLVLADDVAAAQDR
jgi:hypothetical protein